MFFTPLKEKIINNDKEIKSARKELITKKDKGHLSRWQEDKINKKINSLFNKKYELETKFINKNIKDGLYLGIGINLETFDKHTIVLPWRDFINHAIVYGTTRMGKTKLMLNIIRQNLLHGDNVIINDPKGGIDQEILNQVVNFLREAGRETDLIYINPVFPNATEYFNPIYGLGDDDIANLVATILYPNTQGDNAFYSGYTFTILKTILYSLNFLEKAMDPTGEGVAKKERYEQEKYIKIKHLRGKELLSFDVENSIANPDVAERFSADMSYVELGKQNMFNRTLVTFKDLLHYCLHENLSALKGTVESTIAGTPELSLMKTEAMMLLQTVFEIPKEHHSKISVSLVNFLSDVANGFLGSMFCTVRINPLLSRLANSERGFAILMHPSPLRFKKVADNVNKIFMKMLESVYATTSVTGREINKRRLYVHLDEGESSLYQGIEAVLNKMAGLGMTLFIYTQSLADLEARLGTTLAKVSQDSLNTYFVFKMNETDSVRKIHDMFGETSVTNTNIVHGGGEARINFSSNTQSILSSKSISNLRPAEGFLKNLHRRYQISFAYVPDLDPNEGLIVMDEIDTERMFARLLELNKKIQVQGF